MSAQAVTQNHVLEDSEDAFGYPNLVQAVAYAGGFPSHAANLLGWGFYGVVARRTSNAMIPFALGVASGEYLELGFDTLDRAFLEFFDEAGLTHIEYPSLQREPARWTREYAEKVKQASIHLMEHLDRHADRALARMQQRVWARKLGQATVDPHAPYASLETDGDAPYWRARTAGVGRAHLADVLEEMLEERTVPESEVQVAAVDVWTMLDDPMRTAGICSTMWQERLAGLSPSLDLGYTVDGRQVDREADPVYAADGTVTLYRGGVLNSIAGGASWTSSLDVARKFARRTAQCAGLPQGVVYSRLFHSSEVACRINGRDEQEFVSFVSCGLDDEGGDVGELLEHVEVDS